MGYSIFGSNLMVHLVLTRSGLIAENAFRAWQASWSGSPGAKHQVAKQVSWRRNEELILICDMCIYIYIYTHDMI